MRGFRKNAQHETLGFQRHALIGNELHDFEVGQRVMTCDGFPGKVAAINYGPFGLEEYEVLLDKGMGGGTYTSGQLRAEAKVQASVVEASEVYASIPVEAVTDHTANQDYPELENILTERLPNENIRVTAANNTAQDDNDDDESDKLTQQSNDPDDDKDPSGVEEGLPTDEPEDQAQNDGLPNVTPPSACSNCGGTEFGDPQMTGRGTRMRCEQCGATMKSWGGQWEPEFPNSSQNQASEVGDSRSGGVGGVASLPDSNFKTSDLQTNAGLINWVVDKIFDRIQEKVEEAQRGGKHWAAPEHLQDYSGPMNRATQFANNFADPFQPQQLHPNGLTIHSSLDDEWGFHLTAAWVDVQAKARKIRRSGGVKIVSSSKLYVVGEVRGTTNTYESQLNYVPGSKKVADWGCGCKWASYTWGRSKPFQRFEGRLCSHALALQYEAGARGMFGREISEDNYKGEQPVSVKWDKLIDEHLTRSSSLLDSDGVFPEPQLLDLVHPPIYAFAVNMLDNDEPITAVIQMFASFGVEREAAREMMHDAWAEPALNEAESHAKRSLAAGWSTYQENDLEDRTASSYVNEQLWDQNAAHRDLSDHDAEPKHQTDGHKDKKHRTNDAREHAQHWGWGYPNGGIGLGLIACPQCEGSGCGHCAGIGQVPSAEEASPTQSPTDQTPDETPDAGPGISSDGVSTSSLKVQADYSSADPLVGVGDQNYYAPTPSSHSQNPASTGWATSQDPGDWGRSLISNNFGVTFDASLHTTANATSPQEGPTVSGVALKAADTGRVLMIQRSIKDDKDPAKGTWEFPGGHHEEGDQTSLHAGIREWQEETGQPFPEGGHVTNAHRSGPYLLHTVVIPEESGVKFHEGRSLDNPDDPDSDDHENAAWWHPSDAKKNPALRKELKGHAVWGDIPKAASLQTDDLSLDAVLGTYTDYAEATLHSDPEGALPSTDGIVDDETGFPLHQTSNEDNSSTLAGNTVDGPHNGADDAKSIRMAFLQSAGAAAIADGDKSLLAKVAMKDFSFAEQQELINEGKGDRARNFSDLKIAGTHYEQIPDDADDTIIWT